MRRTKQLRVRLIYLLYRAVQAAGFPFILLYFLGRGLKDRRYFHGFSQRLGFLPDACCSLPPGGVWIHAVSVGEVLSSVQLMRRLRFEFPESPLVVSSSTLAGKAAAEEKLRGLADAVIYAPIDYCFPVRRVLRALRPSAVVVQETEIWPNLYRETKRWGAGLLIVNARISDRAAPRYFRLRWFFREVLAWPDAILAQTEVSRRRYLAMGAAPDKVTVAGNLKYDFEPREARAPAAVRTLIERTRPSHVWIAASTMPPARAGDVDEDDAVIAAFREVSRAHSRLLLILVPRRPERFDEAARKLERAAVPFLRRSALTGEESLPLPGVLLLDSIGELGGLFQLADVVFMGGTLAERGGHNVLEPAFFARTVIVGPHMENFPEIAAEFSAAGASVEIRKPEELAAAVDVLLRDVDLRVRLGELARGVAEAKRGATRQAVESIRFVMSSAVPCMPRPLPVRAALWPFSRLWIAGWRWKRSRAASRRRALEAPVVSVGGLSMGGAGKTPLALWLAIRLREAGYRPAILTRGYRRRAPERNTVLAAGETASPERTGDEAQILLRRAGVPLGIGADRAATGRFVEERFRPGVHLLDDGFQHWGLQRRLDIVVIDALDPLAGGDVFPLGRLREPPEALARAGAFVITHAQRGLDYTGLKILLGRINPAAPVFTARLTPEAWVDAESGEQWQPGGLPFARVAAFCGLGNPASFWLTLRAAGVAPVYRWAFRDHHHYRPSELKRLVQEARSAGAQALLTTEKDLMNLGPEALGIFAPLRLCWLRIGMEIDDSSGFLALVEEMICGAMRRRPGSGRPGA